MGSFSFILTAILAVGATASHHERRKCDRPNESLQCVKQCPPARTCDNYNIQVKCGDDDRNCTYQCRCNENYYRDYLGFCVKKKVCEKCRGDNEFFYCGPECDNDCSNIATQNRTNCPIQNIQCNKKCYCKDGYARDLSRKCIPVDQCNASKNCNGPNESLRCVKECPPQRTCANYKIQFNCKEDDTECTYQCWCNTGYYRYRGKCVTKKVCESKSSGY